MGVTGIVIVQSFAAMGLFHIKSRADLFETLFIRKKFHLTINRTVIQPLVAQLKSFDLLKSMIDWYIFKFTRSEDEIS